MKRPKTKKFKHQKDLILHAVKKVITEPKTEQEKIQRAKDRLRTH